MKERLADKKLKKLRKNSEMAVIARIRLKVLSRLLRVFTEIDQTEKNDRNLLCRRQQCLKKIIS